MVDEGSDAEPWREKVRRFADALRRHPQVRQRLIKVLNQNGTSSFQRSIPDSFFPQYDTIETTGSSTFQHTKQRCLLVKHTTKRIRNQNCHQEVHNQPVSRRRASNLEARPKEPAASRSEVKHSWTASGAVVSGSEGTPRFNQ